MSKLKSQLAESRYYKQKVVFMEKENEMLMKTLKNKSFVDDAPETSDAQFDESLLEGAAPALRKQFELLSKTMARKDAMIKRMKSEKSIDLEDVLTKLENGDQKGAIRQIFESQKAVMTKLADTNAKNEKLIRTCTMLQAREKHFQELRQNNKRQLDQMEQAVLMCSKVSKAHQNKFQATLKQKDEEIQKLKTYVKSLQEINARPRSDRKAPVRAAKKPVRARKRRPARATPSPERRAEGVRA